MIHKRALVFCMIALLGLFASVAQAADERPNILFAFADDWGYPHAGVYGDPTVQTPTFDRVAEQGVLFTQAFIASPSCTPSRGGVLSGQHIWRLREGANLWSTLDQSIPVYPDLLAEAGYHVGYTRKGWGPGKLEPGGREVNPAGPKFANFRKFLDQRSEDEPFCFWFGSTDPHRGYDAGLREKMGVEPGEVEVPPYLPDVAATRRDLADYYAEVQRFDREVGRLLKTLKKRGELSNTIVVISGDHGMPFPRCKANLYDSGARVPLAIRLPGAEAGGRKVTDLVSLTDLAPTFLRAAGVDVPKVMTGRSLLPLLGASGSGDVSDQREAVYYGFERHTPAQAAPESGGYPARAVRTDEYLYIRNFEPDRWPAGTPDWQNAYLDKGWLGDCDNGPTKLYMWAHRDESGVKRLYDLAFGKRPAEELYDLSEDPHQMNNLADEPDYAEAKRRLKQKLLAELKRTDDPRVVGGGEKFDEYPYYGGIPKWPGEEKIQQYE